MQRQWKHYTAECRCERRRQRDSPLNILPVYTMCHLCTFVPFVVHAVEFLEVLNKISIVLYMYGRHDHYQTFSN